MDMRCGYHDDALSSAWPARRMQRGQGRRHPFSPRAGRRTHAAYPDGMCNNKFPPRPPLEMRHRKRDALDGIHSAANVEADARSAFL